MQSESVSPILSTNKPPPTEDTRRTKFFLLIYLLSGLYVFHRLIIGFSNSSYIEALTQPAMVGLLYIAGSLFAILLLLSTPTLIKRYQSTFPLVVIGVACTALLCVGLNLSPLLTLTAFVIVLGLIPMIALIIDLLAENLMGNDESQTGTHWALILSAMSGVSILATLTLATLVDDDPSRLTLTYYISAGTLVIFFGVVAYILRRYPLPVQHSTSLLYSIKGAWKNSDIRNSLVMGLLLNLYFAILMIYLPLYLTVALDFSWNTVGLLLSAFFAGFLISEYPLGKLADTRIGETELLQAGFLLTSLVIASVGFIGADDIGLWFSVFFLLGLGGSLIETPLVSYFYKQTTGADSDLLGFNRLGVPLATIIGAVIGSALLFYLSWTALFITISLLVLPGFFLARGLQDTR